MMTGGAIMAWWGGFTNRIHTMVLSSAIMAVCTSLLGLMPNFWAYLVPMGIFGVALPLYNAGATVLLQEHVEPDYLGRVFSIFTMLQTAMMPLGMLVFGPMSEYVRIETLLIVTGIAMGAQLLWVMNDRTLIAAGVPVVRPAEAEATTE